MSKRKILLIVLVLLLIVSIYIDLTYEHRQAEIITNIQTDNWVPSDNFIYFTNNVTETANFTYFIEGYYKGIIAK